jgi:hypothetical protein
VPATGCARKRSRIRFAPIGSGAPRTGLPRVAQIASAASVRSDGGFIARRAAWVTDHRAIAAQREADASIRSSARQARRAWLPTRSHPRTPRRSGDVARVQAHDDGRAGAEHFAGKRQVTRDSPHQITTTASGDVTPSPAMAVGPRASPGASAQG